MDQLPIAIGIGLLVSLLFSELFGLAAGGMVVPGYIALALSHPISVALTIAAGLATFALVQALASFVILYGKRRTVLMIATGYLVGAFMRALFPGDAAQLGAELQEYTVIGYIIPGLIAIWFDRQGIIATTTTLLTAAVVVRLSLVLLAGAELLS